MRLRTRLRLPHLLLGIALFLGFVAYQNASESDPTATAETRPCAHGEPPALLRPFVAVAELFFEVK